MGFVAVANETMARPIRALTESRGHSTSHHLLACFGGAGGQHACAIASTLGIHTVVVHKYSSVLSAYGMALADTAVDVTEPSSLTYSSEALPTIGERFEALKQQAHEKLAAQGIPDEAIVYDSYLNMRYQGSDTALMILEKERGGDFAGDFKAEHIREFSFALQRPIVIDDVRVRATGLGSKLGNIAPRKWTEDIASVQKKKADPALAFDTTSTFFDELNGYCDSPLYRIEALEPGTIVTGPAIILDTTQTLLIHPNNFATILPDHVIIDVGLGPRKAISTEIVDPIQLSIFSNRFMSIAERMGRSLQRTAVSLQIKERLDFSWCVSLCPFLLCEHLSNVVVTALCSLTTEGWCAMLRIFQSILVPCESRPRVRLCAISNSTRYWNLQAVCSGLSSRVAQGQTQVNAHLLHLKMETHCLPGLETFSCRTTLRQAVRLMLVFGASCTDIVVSAIRHTSS